MENFITSPSLVMLSLFASDLYVPDGSSATNLNAWKI